MRGRALCVHVAVGDFRTAAVRHLFIPLRGISAYAGIPLRGMARLRRAVFISFFSGKERNEPKKETTDRNKFACAPGRSDARF